MISKALRPADQRSKHLKRISHHLMGGDRDPSIGKKTLAGDEAIEVAKTTKADKSSEPKKASKAAEAGKKEKSGKHDMEGKAGKDKKSRKHDKKGKAGKDKKGKAAAAEPAKPQKPIKKKAAEEPVAAAPAPIAAAQAEPGRAQPEHLALIPTLSEVNEADATPPPNTLPAAKTTQQQVEQESGQKVAAAIARRIGPGKVILLFGLIGLFGLWGYRYWYAGDDAMETAQTPPDTAGQDQQQASQPVAAVQQQEEAIRSVVAVQQQEEAIRSVVATPEVKEAAPPKGVVTSESRREPAAADQQTSEVVPAPTVKEAAQPKVVATSKRKPEPAAAIKQTSRPVAPKPQPRFRPPAYGQYPPYSAWRPPVAAPSVSKPAPPKVVATSKRKPEPAAAIKQTSKPVAPKPQPRFRPPAYGQYPRHPAWRPPIQYDNYPWLPSRQPLPRGLVRDQKTAAAKDTK